ncbi:MAG: [protein-PII] uridylyltransferase [Desulfovibrionaceae bacterium]
MKKKTAAAHAAQDDSAAARLDAARTHCIATSLPGPQWDRAGCAFEAAYSGVVDAFLRERLAEIQAGIPQDGEPFAVVAVGGYGRAQLSLGSDIDLLLVCPDAIPPHALDLAQPLFLPLWDMGFALGHGFRTINDCIDLSRKDYQVFASLLDARFIAGDPAVHEQLVAQFQRRVVAKRGKRFLEWLLDGADARRRRFGDAASMLEPQIKEGVGGLRDVHRIYWLAKVVHGGPQPGAELARLLMGDEDFAQLEADHALVLAARDRLHQASGRKNDVLYLDLQPGIAAGLGFGDEGGVLGVERFLARLHGAMASIKALAEAFWHAHGPARPVAGLEGAALETAMAHLPEGVILGEGGLAFASDAAVDEEPLRIMRLFEAMNALGAPLSWHGRKAVAARLDLVRGELAASTAAYAILERILLSGRAYGTLVQMHEIGVLGALLPEFATVQDIVQFDAYHTWPVGRHTLEVIRNLETLDAAQIPVFSRLWSEVGDKRALLLAALFHDLGKGRKKHEELGAAIARDVLSRWGVADGVAREVVFLVRCHLELAVTATHRDLGDEAEVVRVAGLINEPAKLKRLYLLTYADAHATGPKAWSEWSARLMSELFFKVLHILEQSKLAVPHAAQKMLRTRDRVRQQAALYHKETLPAEKVAYYLEQLPPRYTLNTEAEDMLRHMELVRELEREIADAERRLPPARAMIGVVAVTARRMEEGIWEVSVAAKDQPGIFAAIAGVLSLQDINIFAADVYVWRDGTVVDVLRVSNPPDALYPDEAWKRARSAVRFAMTGKLFLDYRIEQKRLSPLAGGAPPPRPVTVRVNNDISDFYTVIEVKARDRIGLLFEIAHTLNQLQVDVHVAKAATHGCNASDVFYVRDAYHQKIVDEAQVEEVRRALTHRLGRKPQPLDM